MEDEWTSVYRRVNDAARVEKAAKRAVVKDRSSVSGCRGWPPKSA
jgi:hypothetical protein